MNYFDFPLDTKMLLRKKRGIKKELLQLKQNRITKKIAVLGGSTTNELVDQLELFLLNYGIEASFYQSEYAQYYQDAMFSNPELDEFKPDIVYIHTDWRNIIEFPSVGMDESTVDAMLESEYARFESMWKSIESRFSCPIIQNNFERPNYRLMGNRDIWDCAGRANFLQRLNMKFYDYARNHSSFYINDIEYIQSLVGLNNWNDSLKWNMYKYAMSLEAVCYVADNLSKIIKSIYGCNKKVLALDLDNTLWGGVVGDDGVEGIAIGPEVPSGQVYAEFQSYCKNLKGIGVLLAVNSKNDESNALAGLNHPDGILKPEDFVAIKANWEAKNINLCNLANELTLGVDSFVFADDNPAERAIVEDNLPGVSVPEMDAVENYIKRIDYAGYFEVTNLSSEDMNKTKMYAAKAAAAAAVAQFSNYDEYLDSLSMKAIIGNFEPIYIQRIAQLTNKSNQFNLTTLRCTEDDIKNFAEDKNYICYYGKLIDKFADNGVVTVVVGEKVAEVLHIRLWLMSCRVLKRGMEDAMMNTLIERAKTEGIRKICGYYYPTPKNAMVKEFYQQFGFEKVSEDTDGNAVWTIEADKYKEKDVHIEIQL